MEIIFSVLGLLLICGGRFASGWVKICLVLLGSVGLIVGNLDRIGVGLIVAGVVCCASGIITKKVHGVIISEVNDVILYVLGIVEVIIGFVIAA